MAPIRRYLRISKYSVLECRIYLENPADSRWLLDSRDPVLPRIFKTIKPLVLPKLREENERALAKKKSNPVKDVIAEGTVCDLIPDRYVATFPSNIWVPQMTLKSPYSYENPERVIHFSQDKKNLDNAKTPTAIRTNVRMQLAPEKVFWSRATKNEMLV
jgi:hypothetical protein